jgi:LytS/YehU family sensor histidine kinase
LAEEIETLNLYINLESMLLENDFHYELKVNPTVETNSIQIPALLLQPYIENSFKHGLRHKKGDKKIS